MVIEFSKSGLVPLIEKVQQTPNEHSFSVLGVAFTFIRRRLPKFDVAGIQPMDVVSNMDKARISRTIVSHQRHPGYHHTEPASTAEMNASVPPGDPSELK